MKTYCRPWLLFFFLCATVTSQDLGEKYISEWKKFYPSKALKSGIHTALFNYENRSKATVVNWLEFNKSILQKLYEKNPNIDRIDGRLLRVQAQSEVDKWETTSEHTASLRLYSSLILNALPPVFDADFLLIPEKTELVCKRLISIKQITTAALTNLKKMSKGDMERGLVDLSKSLDYLNNGLEGDMSSSGFPKTCDYFKAHLSTAIQGITTLQNHMISSLQKNTGSLGSVLGQVAYNQRLKLYTDSELTSTKLAEMAFQEIKTVKSLMAEVSKAYISETYPDKALSKNDLDLITMALRDMEKDAPLNSGDYLQFWRQLTDAAVKFIQENDIATLPKDQTLRIQTAPEIAGSAARIGWVASAPPFDPNPMTTLNLPSIPETVPKQEQLDFWASFNKPFNRMIVIHELFPGHYMQFKISRETPHPVRMLFPFGIYIEGWATFTEKVLLDAGWEADNHLTLLAHLRKRLENANRSYTSVQVHCNGWNQDEVMKFSTETSLLAPQFAKSLWGRIINSPLQLTSYYLGGAQFTELLHFEKNRLGNTFDLKLFMDTILKAGPIPIDEFYRIFKNTVSN